MKPFLILALAALANARPEAGYAYNAPAPAAPSSSYGTPSSGGGFGGGHGGSGFGGGSHGGSGFGGGSLGFSGLGGGFGGSGGSGGGSFGGAQSFSSGGSSSFGGSFGGGQSFSSGSSFGGFQSQAPLVSKHVYVHVAPEEPSSAVQQRIVAPSQPRKHYKIVFIKAPTAATPTGAQVQLPQQDEEKTIIYVLSKKEEAQAEINVQAAAPTTPTKPEVYFIKYNTQKGQGGSGLGLSAQGGSGLGLSSGAGAGHGGSGHSGAGLSSSYGAPASISANAAPSSSYGVPSSNGGHY